MAGVARYALGRRPLAVVIGLSVAEEGARPVRQAPLRTAVSGRPVLFVAGPNQQRHLRADPRSYSAETAVLRLAGNAADHHLSSLPRISNDFDQNETQPGQCVSGGARAYKPSRTQSAVRDQ